MNKDKEYSKLGSTKECKVITKECKVIYPCDFICDVITLYSIIFYHSSYWLFFIDFVKIICEYYTDLYIKRFVNEQSRDQILRLITAETESKFVVMPWVPAKNGEVPQGADYAGFTKLGERIYIARAEHQGALLPGKVIISKGCAFVPWGGLEHQKKEYEVLVDGPKNWVPYKGPKIPLKSFPGGKTESHEVLFIGRITYQEETTPGKVQVSHNALYIPLEGKEVAFKDNFEILCR